MWTRQKLQIPKRPLVAGSKTESIPMDDKCPAEINVYIYSRYRNTV